MMQNTYKLGILLLIVSCTFGIAVAQHSTDGGGSTANPTAVPTPDADSSIGTGQPIAFPTFPPPDTETGRIQPIFATPGPNQGVPPEVYAELTAWYQENMANPCAGDPDCVYVNSWDDIQIPAEFPQSLEELQALLNTSALQGQFDLTSLALSFGGSSEEAYNAIAGFAASHLGAQIEPVFAQKVRTGIVSDGAIPPQLISQLSPEVQLLITAAQEADIQGAAYYALLDDGFAVVFTAADCSGRRCTVDLETLQLTIEEASLGVYTIYRDTTVNSTDAAYSLILNTFPGLINYTLVPVPSSTGTGYVFSYVDNAADGATAFYVWVNTIGNRSAIYFTGAIGTGYVSLGLGLGS